MLQWKIFMVMALIGHILCGISDGFLTYAPNGKVDLTIGSALDIFGGKGAKYFDCIEYNKKQK